MSEMTLFGADNPLVNSDLYKSLRDMNKTLAGGSGGGKRISIKGNKFRLFIDGEQVSVSKADYLNIVVVNVAPISRTYYEGTYDPNSASAPTCWSTDTRTPAAEVPADQKKASRCADCPMNVKGSGQGDNSRACRYNQRLAITLEGKPDEVYQLQLPATSLFGDSKNGKMPMQAYAKFLDAHNTPIIAVMTKMSLDENSETPKLFFSPVRPLTEEELHAAVAVKDSEAAIKAITLTVAQTDGVKKKDSAAGTKSYNPAKEKIIVDDEDEVEEPKKVAAKKTAAVSTDAKANISALVAQWDDE